MAKNNYAYSWIANNGVFILAVIIFHKSYILNNKMFHLFEGE